MLHLQKRSLIYNLNRVCMRIKQSFQPILQNVILFVLLLNMITLLGTKMHPKHDTTFNTYQPKGSTYLTVYRVFLKSLKKILVNLFLQLANGLTNQYVASTHRFVKFNNMQHFIGVLYNFFGFSVMITPMCCRFFLVFDVQTHQKLNQTFTQHLECVSLSDN